MKKTTIRKASNIDFNLFYDFFEKTLDDAYFQYSPLTIKMIKQDLSKGSLKNGIRSGNRILFLAFIGEQLVGYLLTLKVNGGVSFGHWLAVDKRFQKRGIASQMILFWEQSTLLEGAHMLELYTTKNNKEFYAKQGFTFAGKFPNGWFGVDHFQFYKLLRPFDEGRYYKDRKYADE